MFTLNVGSYAMGDNPRVTLIEDGEPYATLSVNLPGTSLPAGVFWLKDWSENRLIAESLLEDGAITIVDDIEPQSSGFVVIYAARIVKEVTG